MHEPSSLAAHLGYWLRYVSNHVSGAFGERLARRGITIAEWVALRDTYDRAVSPSALAERLGMTRGAISKLVDRLEAKALLRTCADADDGRARVLALTAKGRALVPRLAALADENDAAFFGHLSEREHESLERTLRTLVRHHGWKSTPVD